VRVATGGVPHGGAYPTRREGVWNPPDGPRLRKYYADALLHSASPWRPKVLCKFTGKYLSRPQQSAPLIPAITSIFVLFILCAKGMIFKIYCLHTINLCVGLVIVS
jgi:hypothetical protein